MTDLSKLIRRVEAATVGNRELDAAVADYFGPPRVDVGVVLPEGFGPPDDFGRWDPDFTTSLDDALSLVERVNLHKISRHGQDLGGYAVDITRYEGTGLGKARLWNNYDGLREYKAKAPTPALALLLAMLKALEANHG